MFHVERVYCTHLMGGLDDVKQIKVLLLSGLGHLASSQSLCRLLFPDSIHRWVYGTVAQDVAKWRALVNTVMNLRVLQNTGRFLSNCTTGDLLRRAQLLGVSSKCPKDLRI
jgi:hypothetical protein